MIAFITTLFLQIMPIDSFTLKKSEMLLLDMDMQIEVTSAINNLYNFKFEEAEKEFIFMRFRYPDHPLPYFLLGLAQWWKIIPNIYNEAYDEEFEQWMDLAIEKARTLYDTNKENIEARFFLAAAWGLKARLYSERGDYGKATVASKNTLSHFELDNENNDLSPEFLFGDGLYNYYSEWIRDRFPLLKPVMAFFPDGDKEKGIKQLKYVANNAFYTRTEAQHFLLGILSSENGDANEALRLAEYLHYTYPGNPYFHRAYARVLYQYGRYDRLVPVCTSILNKLDSGQTGYEANSGRYASFFLGQYFELMRDPLIAEKYYLRAKVFGEEADAEEAGYYLYTLLRLGKINEDQGNKKIAKDYYKQAKKLSGRGSKPFRQAKDYLKDL